MILIELMGDKWNVNLFSFALDSLKDDDFFLIFSRVILVLYQIEDRVEIQYYRVSVTRFFTRLSLWTTNIVNK